MSLLGEVLHFHLVESRDKGEELHLDLAKGKKCLSSSDQEVKITTNSKVSVTMVAYFRKKVVIVFIIIAIHIWPKVTLSTYLLIK